MGRRYLGNIGGAQVRAVYDNANAYHVLVILILLDCYCSDGRGVLFADFVGQQHELTIEVCPYHYSSVL